MSKRGKDIIRSSGKPPFFKLSNAGHFDSLRLENRRGDSLRTWVSSLSGFQKEAIVKSSRTGEAWRLVSDEGAYLNGHDAAPCPLAFLTVGMVSSYMNEILALCEGAGVTVRKLRLVQDNFYTMTGSMRKRTMVGGAEPVELKVEIDCDLDDGKLYRLLTNAIHASPLNGLMRGRLDSLFKLSKNGVELAPEKVKQLDAPIVPYANGAYAEIAIDATKVVPMEAIGPTPSKAVLLGTSRSGSSLSDEQDRRLNIGAVAMLREDGIKDIQQMQYSPYGTSFRFLSEEAPANGGHGRAPDANTYISAGIGFCFMTQFGRFASMLNLDLPEYRIVQDTHFSLGGASGGTGVAGTSDAVETHVHLSTSESDDVAREMLDVSEQTCFLHAFCRTDLKTKLKVVRL